MADREARSAATPPKMWVSPRGRLYAYFGGPGLLSWRKFSVERVKDDYGIWLRLGRVLLVGYYRG